MRRLKILALVLAILSLFIACNKDDAKTNTTTKNSNSKTTAGGGDSDAWWKQYVTKASGSKTTAKSSATTQKSSATTKKSSATTAKNSSGGGGSANANSGGGSSGGTTTSQLPYNKVNQYTMTYSNTDGGTTTLSKDPANKFIKAAINDLSSARHESYPSNQMMAIIDSSSSAPYSVFVYSSTNRSNATLIYVINFKSDASLDPFSGNNDYAYFPFASNGESGSPPYSTYRSNYVTAMNSAEPSLYEQIKSTYSSAESDSNVKVFLSWQ